MAIVCGYTWEQEGRKEGGHGSWLMRERVDWICLRYIIYFTVLTWGHRDYLHETRCCCTRYIVYGLVGSSSMRAGLVGAWMGFMGRAFLAI